MSSYRVYNPWSGSFEEYDDESQCRNAYKDELNVMCCGEEAKWVENGIDLKYWFCDVCRKEVDGP